MEKWSYIESYIVHFFTFLNSFETLLEPFTQNLLGHQDSKSKVNESTYFKKSYNKSCVLGQQHSKGHFLILHLQMYKKLHIWFCSTAKPNGAKLQTDFLFSL